MDISNIGNKCTGCFSCYNSCPVDAITMVQDEGGFDYPHIDGTLCVNCGKCYNSCPASEEVQLKDSRIKAYYGMSKNKEIVKHSSSGGAFSVMAEYILNNNGVVYGAAFADDFKSVVYKSTENCSLDDLRRSKYVASLPGVIYSDVLDKLTSGKYVLFCGLPCHVAGLKKFLKKEYEKLLTCDFICGGTASPKMFNEHISYLEKKYKANVSDVNFRAKLFGWKEHSIKICFQNGKEYKSLAQLDRFFKGYFQKPYQRNSCYFCNYRLAHVSDVIIADYWDGLRNGRADNSGVSMVITNSVKGDQFFRQALTVGNANFIEMPLEDSNYVFKTEEERYTKAFNKRAEFFGLYEKYGFKKAASKTYFKGIRMKKIKLFIKKYIKK